MGWGGLHCSVDDDDSGWSGAAASVYSQSTRELHMRPYFNKLQLPIEFVPIVRLIHGLLNETLSTLWHQLLWTPSSGWTTNFYSALLVSLSLLYNNCLLTGMRRGFRETLRQCRRWRRKHLARFHFYYLGRGTMGFFAMGIILLRDNGFTWKG